MVRTGVEGEYSGAAKVDHCKRTLLGESKLRRCGVALGLSGGSSATLQHPGPVCYSIYRSLMCQSLITL